MSVVVPFFKHTNYSRSNGNRPKNAYKLRQECTKQTNQAKTTGQHKETCNVNQQSSCYSYQNHFIFPKGKRLPDFSSESLFCDVSRQFRDKILIAKKRFYKNKLKGVIKSQKESKGVLRSQKESL